MDHGGKRPRVKQGTRDGGEGIEWARVGRRVQERKKGSNEGRERKGVGQGGKEGVKWKLRGEGGGEEPRIK